MAKLNKTPLAIRAKRGTAAEIEAYTGYQLSGEFGYATDTNKLYVSNGTQFLTVGGGTLQSVTDEGNTTTNNIGIGTVVLRSSSYLNVKPTSNYGVLVRNSGNDSRYISMGVPGDYGFIKYKENSASAITLNATGVGIGTTAPTEKLDVVGNIRAYASTGTATIGTEKDGNYVRLNSDGTSGYISYGNINGSSCVLRFFSNSSEVARFDSSGNVGIGTTAPAYKLDVVGASRIQNELTLGNNTGTAGILHFKNPGFGSYIQSNGYYIFNTLRNVGNQFRIKHAIASSEFDIYTLADDGVWYLTPRGPNNSNGKIVIRNPNNSDKFVFDTNAGNVGIGTAAPNSKVHINGTAMRQLRMENSGGPGSSGDTNGRIGDMAYDDDYFYIKTANGWGRMALDFGF